jgi:hypothetical protein
VKVLSTAARWLPTPRRATLLFSCATIGAFFMLWNLVYSPDTQYDEVVYSRADQAVAQDWRLTWTNRPLFVHPPLSFLAQALWLRLRGLTNAPLVEVIDATRLLAALVTVANVVLLAMLTHRFVAAARPRLRVVLTLLTALLAATDPVLLRYGRMAMIEPFALLGCLITVHLAMTLQARRASVYVPVIGLATGLTLLTNEVGIFMVLTPLLYAVIDRDGALVRRAAAALGVGLALWSVFTVWAVQLGLLGSFVDVKSVTLQRLIGLVQITGWNRPGVSFLGGISAELGQYVGTYLVLALGAVALVWLFVHRGARSSRWLLAWLITSYAFGTYTVLLGTLNEQFFVYVVPAALVATVLMAEAVLGRRTWSMALAGVALGLLLLSNTGSWARFSATRNDGLARLTGYVDTHLPRCATLNITGDVDRFQLLMPGRPISDFATGPGALSHGVNLFVLSEKDAELRFGNASPALTSWVRAHGTRLVSYPSATYHGLELWQVADDPYGAAVGIERFSAGGDFVLTELSRCGGFAVTDSATGQFATGWAKAGGKAVAGAPLTSSWPDRGGHQVFTGAVLDSIGHADGRTTFSAAPVVARLAARDPTAYRAADLPPFARPAGPVVIGRRSVAPTYDPAISGAYQGELRRLLGAPLGPPAAMPDGYVRQPFAGGVLEREVDSPAVRLAPIGQLALDAGLVTPPPGALAPVTPPRLPVVVQSAQPSTVEPFVWTLAAVLVLYAVASAVVIARRDGDPGRSSPSRTYGPSYPVRLLARLGVGRSGRGDDPPSDDPPGGGRPGGDGLPATARVSGRAKVAVPPGLGPPVALGSLVSVGRQHALARIGMLALLLALGLAVRSSGLLQDEPSTLPALPDAAVVAPGVVRSGQPNEPDLVRIRDDYGVRAVIAINGRDDSTLSAVEEQTVAASLGLRFEMLRIPDDAALTPAQVSVVAKLLLAMNPSAQTSPNLVLVHDRTGRGPVLLLSAVIKVLDRQPVDAVLDSVAGLSLQQRLSIRQMAAAVGGSPGPNNPYVSLAAP